MNTVRIHTSAEYTIDSHGHGFAYTITRSDGISIFMQGEDAAQLEEDTADFQDICVLEDYFGCLES